MKKTLRKTLRTAEHILLRKLLVDARTEAGLSQAQVADTLQWPQSDVSKIETGERRLDVIEFVRLCKALGEEPSDLIKKLS